MDEMRLSKILGFADTDIGKLAKVYLEEASTIKELKTKIDTIFAAKTSCENFEKEFAQIKECLENAPYQDNFSDLEKYITEQTALKEENLSKPLRYILTGANKGPALCELYPLIKNYLGEIIK
jgi:glutamyl-tRNA synthetase